MRVAEEVEDADEEEPEREWGPVEGATSGCCCFSRSAMFVVVAVDANVVRGVVDGGEWQARGEWDVRGEVGDMI